MPRVTISCPKTGAPVSTGHIMNQHQLDASSARFAFRCTDCGEIHHFVRTDAWLREARGVYR